MSRVLHTDDDFDLLLLLFEDLDFLPPDFYPQQQILTSTNTNQTTKTKSTDTKRPISSQLGVETLRHTIAIAADTDEPLPRAQRCIADRIVIGFALLPFDSAGRFAWRRRLQFGVFDERYAAAYCLRVLDVAHVVVIYCCCC
jgi:hypothetical protein